MATSTASNAVNYNVLHVTHTCPSADTRDAHVSCHELLGHLSLIPVDGLSWVWSRSDGHRPSMRHVKTPLPTNALHLNVAHFLLALIITLWGEFLLGKQLSSTSHYFPNGSSSACFTSGSPNRSLQRFLYESLSIWNYSVWSASHYSPNGSLHRLLYESWVKNLEGFYIEAVPCLCRSLSLFVQKLFLVHIETFPCLYGSLSSFI